MTKTYKQLRAELDEVLAWFDADNLDVDQAIVKYEQAIKLTNELQDYLKQAENKLTKLK